MNTRRTSRGRRAAARVAALGFVMSFGVLVSVQLALISVLDVGRAQRAAEQIATSRFTADLIEQTVVRAAAPIAGDGLAFQAAAVASSDPRVRDVIVTSLLDAHRQIVDRDAPTEIVDGNVAVGSAILQSVIDGGAANGLDVAALGLDTGAVLDPATVAGGTVVPEIVPDDLPRLGLRDVADTVRVIALAAIVFFSMTVVLIHPQTGRAIRTIGRRVAAVCGGWLALLLIGGWVIGLFANTLFGEMIDALWSDAVPSMALFTAAGLLIGVALLFAGIAVDGFARERSRHRVGPHVDHYTDRTGY